MSGMAQPTTPVPLIVLARRRDLGEHVHRIFMPKCFYNAIMTSWSKTTLINLMDNLNPTPIGVVIGGGFDEQVAAEVREALKEWDNERDRKVNIKVLTTPKTLMESKGPTAVAEHLKERLAEEFGVAW